MYLFTNVSAGCNMSIEVVCGKVLCVVFLT